MVMIFYRATSDMVCGWWEGLCSAQGGLRLKSIVKVHAAPGENDREIIRIYGLIAGYSPQRVLTNLIFSNFGNY